VVKVIAEWGQSCQGDLDQAIAQARTAKECGCAFSKYQTFQTDRLVSRTAARYWDRSLGGSDTQAETFNRNGMLPPSAWRELAAACKEIGVGLMSSPFDLEAVDLLVDAGVDALKIASGEITHRQLIERVAETGLPVVLSTGAATAAEIDAAVVWLSPTVPILLACTLSYPTATANAELGRISTLRRRFLGCQVGYSDHTIRTDTAMVAAALGATMLEKHCTLSSQGDVPDDKMALEPDSLKLYVRYAQLGAAMRGSGELGASETEQAARTGARRSLHAARDIAAGETFKPGDFVCLRPGDGLPPAWDRALFGRTAGRPIVAGAQLKGEDIA